MSSNKWACENVSGPVWMAIVCKPLLTVEWGIDNCEKDCRWCVADTLSNYDNYYVDVEVAYYWSPKYLTWQGLVSSILN